MKCIIADKAVCLDTVMQVLILKDLECTKIVQNASILRALASKGFVAKAAAEELGQEGGHCEWKVLARRPGWSVEFKG